MVSGISCDLQLHKTDYLAITKGLYHEDLQRVYTYQPITILHHANRNLKATPFWQKWNGIWLLQNSVSTKSWLTPICCHSHQARYNFCCFTTFQVQLMTRTQTSQSWKSGISLFILNTRLFYLLWRRCTRLFFIYVCQWCFFWRQYSRLEEFSRVYYEIF